MSDQMQCEICRAVVPIAKSYAGKALGGAVGGALALRSRSFGGAVLTAVSGVLVGHVIDELAAPVCGHCGSRMPQA